MWSAESVFFAFATVFIPALTIFLFLKFTRSTPSPQKASKGETRVIEINVYPVKSCKGISVPSADFDKFGFVHDRRWMIVRDGNFKFISQRDYPKVALIIPKITNDHVILTAPQCVEPLQIPFQINEEEKKKIEVELWRVKYPALDEGDVAATWLSNYIGRPVRLARMMKDHGRLVEEEYAVSGLNNTVSFGDGYPFLLATDASLHELNRRLSNEPVRMDRFRPNIVIGLCGEDHLPFTEDRWEQIEIGQEIFHVVKPCSRCKTTTVDQNTGKFAGPEPLATLSAFRSGDDGKAVYFGQNLIQQSSCGTITVGDRLRVVTRKDPLKLKQDSG